MTGSEISFGDDVTYGYVSDDRVAQSTYQVPPSELDVLRNDQEARPGELVGQSIEYSNSEDEATNGIEKEHSSVENERVFITSNMLILSRNLIENHHNGILISVGHIRWYHCLFFWLIDRL